MTVERAAWQFTIHSWIQRGRHRPRWGQLRAWRVGQRCTKVIQASGAHASLHQAEGQPETSPQARGRNRPNADPARPRTSQHLAHPQPRLLSFHSRPGSLTTHARGPPWPLVPSSTPLAPPHRGRAWRARLLEGTGVKGHHTGQEAKYPPPGPGRLAWDLLPLTGATHPDS